MPERPFFRMPERPFFRMPEKALFPDAGKGLARRDTRRTDFKPPDGRYPPDGLDTRLTDFKPPDGLQAA
jgi:hypothetical protein